MSPETLRSILGALNAAERGHHFMGKPDRWYEPPLYRCPNDHVVDWYVKSESRGNVCPLCFTGVHLTFPEDGTGPLVTGKLKAALFFAAGVAVLDSQDAHAAGDAAAGMAALARRRELLKLAAEDFSEPSRFKVGDWVQPVREGVEGIFQIARSEWDAGQRMWRHYPKHGGYYAENHLEISHEQG